MEDFHLQYSDNIDEDELVDTMHANFMNEIEVAWQAFLAEIEHEE